jgi:hypothetical protein
MVNVIIQVEYCNSCPFSTKDCRQVGLSTNDDYVLDWYCSKLGNKKIRGGVDFGEKVEIPEFCPFQVDNKESTP